MKYVGKIYIAGWLHLHEYGVGGCIYPTPGWNTRRKTHYKAEIIFPNSYFIGITEMIPTQGYTEDDFIGSFVYQLRVARKKEWPKSIKRSYDNCIGKVYKPSSDDEIWLCNKTIKELRADFDETYEKCCNHYSPSNCIPRKVMEQKMKEVRME